MEFFKLYKRFNRQEEGAVTVDWVVLTSAVVGLGLIVLAAVRGGTKQFAENISKDLASRTVISN